MRTRSNCRELQLFLEQTIKETSLSAARHGEQVSTDPVTPANRVDQFFTVAEARFDRWRKLLQAARQWERSSADRKGGQQKDQSTVSAIVEHLRHWEDFFAYLGLDIVR